MRTRRHRVIMTFHTTTDALSVESCCAQCGVSGRLIPVPSLISAGCGMCFSAPPEERQALRDAAARAGVTPAGVYEMML